MKAPPTSPSLADRCTLAKLQIRACVEALAAVDAFARARALLACDAAAADKHARETFAAVQRLGHDCAQVDMPARLLVEPALHFALELGRACQQETVRLRALLHHHACAHHETDRSRHLAQLQAFTPTPERLMALLQAGRRLSLSQHTLALDTDMGPDILVGTNAYGCDYFGTLTLRYVTWWRQVMIQGKDLGPVPPCSQEPADDAEASYFADLCVAEAITHDLDEHYRFGRDLRSVVVDQAMQQCTVFKLASSPLDLCAVLFSPAVNGG